MEKLKNIIKLIKSWIVSNGGEGVLGLLLGLLLWILGYKIWAGVSFGVFAHKNWDIVKSWLNKSV